MDLRAVLLLSTLDKRDWIRSDDGLAQLRCWTNEGISLRQIAYILQLNSETLYAWRRYYEIGAILGHKKTKKPDFSRPLAYRIIAGLNEYRRGVVLEEYQTGEELWDTDFVRDYFASYNCSPDGYFDAYLKNIAHSGVYKLSNTYAIAYCSINHKGVIKPLVPTS